MITYEIYMGATYAGTTLIYSTADDDAAHRLAESPVADLQVNAAGQLTFCMPPGHACYDSIQEMVTVISLRKNGQVIWSGRAVKIVEDLWKRRKVTCEGALAYLNDSIQPQEEYHITGATAYREYLIRLIQIHNEQVDTFKQFEIGQVTMLYYGVSYYRYTTYQTTMKELSDDLIEDVGGFLRVRYEDGHQYLDYIEDYDRTCDQQIEFGTNLLDFSKTIDCTNLATRIIPLGAKIESESETPGTDTPEGLQERLTIASVNDGKVYLESEAAQTYGTITQAVIWDDVTTAQALKAKGQEWLNDSQYENLVLTVKAVDLLSTSGDFDSFNLGDAIRVVSQPHGMNRNFPLTKMQIYLDAPQKNTITLGTEIKNRTLSAKSAQTQYQAQEIEEKVPDQNRILALASQNAAALINAATHGHVITEPDRILIMDTDNIETATKIWQWNLNGLAYSGDGGQTYETAITMDGTIMGNFLAARSVAAEVLNVEFITSTGIDASYINTGSLVVKDDNGNIIFEASIDGHRVYIRGDNVQIGGEPLTAALDTLNDTVDTKTRTWYQATDPALEWDNLLDHNGEPILDHNGEPFVLTSDAGANGHIGDIWQMVSDDPALNGTIWLYTESGWVTNAYTTLQGVKNNLTQQDIFEKLTGGSPGGLYLLNGRVYLDATYINVGDGANLYSNYDTMAQIPNDRDAITWRANDDTNGNIADLKLVESTRISGNSLRIVNKGSVTSSGGYVFLGNSENGYGLVHIMTGHKYRISFFARSINVSSVSLKLWFVKAGSRTTKPENSQCYSQETFTLTMDWERFSYFYDNTTDENTGNVACSYLGLGFANLTASAGVAICGIMIEEVENASQAPSPFAPAGTTQINGGTIKTESIDATSIKAKSITSDQIDVVGGWKINANNIQSTNGNIKLYPNNPGASQNPDSGRIVIGLAELGSESNAFVIKYGLHVYTNSPSQITDGSDLFKLIGLTSVSSGEHLVLDIDGETVCRLSASSKRYKDPCGLATLDDVSKLLNLPVVWFKYKDGYLRKGDRFEGKPMIGLYAEDVYEAMPEAAQINTYGQIEDWNHRILIPAMLKLIQSQHDKIQSLEERISKLEKLLIKESD